MNGAGRLVTLAQYDARRPANFRYFNRRVSVHLRGAGLRVTRSWLVARIDCRHVERVSARSASLRCDRERSKIDRFARLKGRWSKHVARQEAVRDSDVVQYRITGV